MVELHWHCAGPCPLAPCLLPAEWRSGSVPLSAHARSPPGYSRQQDPRRRLKHVRIFQRPRNDLRSFSFHNTMKSEDAMAIRRESATSERPRADGWTIVSLGFGRHCARVGVSPAGVKRARRRSVDGQRSKRAQRTNGKRRSLARSRPRPPRSHRVAGRTFCCASTRTSRNIECWRSRRA